MLVVLVLKDRYGIFIFLFNAGWSREFSLPYFFTEYLFQTSITLGD